MTIGEIAAGGGGILLVVMTVLQIAPIKINPWGWIAKAIGRAINSVVIEKVDTLEKKIDEVDAEVKTVRAEFTKKDIKTARIRILRFGDEVSHGVKHSKDSFDATLIDIDDYERYCGKHDDFENTITHLTSLRIKEAYALHLKNNDFL